MWEIHTHRQTYPSLRSARTSLRWQRSQPFPARPGPRIRLFVFIQHSVRPLRGMRVLEVCGRQSCPQVRAVSSGPFALGLALLHHITLPAKHCCPIGAAAPIQRDKIPHLFPLISVFKRLIYISTRKFLKKDDRGDSDQSRVAHRLLCFFFNSVSWILTDFLMHTPLILN